MACWRRSRRRAAPATLDLIIHGTTATTNAVLERKLAKVGLITTAGSATCWSSGAARARAPMA
jgi:N-methylhydantoinase A/oxoprolinase/acetone carboxylase beta subunit